MINRLFIKINKFIPDKWKWILEHEGFKKYFKNTGWMFFGQMFSLLVSFFVGAWLARYLGPENYGIVNYVVAFVSMFSFIAYLGVHNILLRDLVKYPEKEKELMGTSFIVLLTGSFLAIFLIIISSFLFENSVFNRVLILIYSFVFLFSPFGIISVFFQSKVQARKGVKVSIISAFVASIFKILIIYYNEGIIYLILVFVLEAFLSTIFYIYFYKKSGFKVSDWKFNKSVLKSILSGSIFLMVASAASYIFSRVDQIMIKNFLGETSVGVYSAALKLVEIWYFIPLIICNSLLPAIINSREISIKKYKNRLNKLYIFLGGIAFVIAVILTLFSDSFIIMLFGPEYSASISILKIYSWAGIGYFLSVGFYQYFLAENKLKLIFFFYLLLMLINIILNLFLIPRIGLTGAAWSTLISYFFGLLIFILLRKNKFYDKKAF